ncbi:hypothetical protein FB45DRAFT_911664 [Roridomyces roridus]|uniref:Knr4/Smi1-like domain-containing protein n=1 Tax=Roridomyces roridus TaxID=1738132 RepID=A0AAD7BW10_9AGAR|nr:hypothetical protein FB45DRAFT_911664 [Roridomyces roridus]
MGWFSNLFSAAPSSQDSRRGQALSSTNDAFSLGPHPDAFNAEALEAGAGPSYTYPPPSSPQGSPIYGYVPTSAGSRHSSLLPMHNDALPPPRYPPPAVTWNRLRAWLAREYPELGDTLNYGILPQDLAQFEMQFGLELPPAVRESYIAVDGQEAESAAGCSEGLFFGLTLLPLEDALEEWQFWREVDDDPSTGANVQLRESMRSVPTGWIRKEYAQRGWIPLIADKAGNYVGVDLNPEEGGSVGQVIVFGRDFDTKVVLWTGDGPDGWAKWLACFVDDLESGEGYEIGNGDTSDEGEDDLGYESYFYDGNGRGQGDGGGDNGAGGGLRLSGEYRGWNVLEAWADRSMRKWHEMGLITESLGPPEEKEVKPNAGLGVLLPSDAEVPIPVVSSGEDATTPDDIEMLPSPLDDSRSSYQDDDLESGRALGMREFSGEPSFVPRRAPSAPSPPVPIPDLLADSAPPMDAAPITPSHPLASTASPELVSVSVSSSPPPTESPAPPPTLDSASLAEQPVEQPAEPAAEQPAEPVVEQPAEPEPAAEQPEPAAEQPEPEPEPEVDPDVTIRLVGGGGIAGTSVEEATVEGDAQAEDGVQTDGEVDTDVESVSSQAATDANGAPKEKKHKKTMSGLAGLKKLGGLGVRKKDSSASVKDIAVPAAS